MPILRHSYDSAIAQIADLIKKQEDIQSILVCFEKIFTAQDKVKESFEPDLKGLDFNFCKQENSDNRPFLNADNCKISWTLFDTLFDEIRTITRPLVKTGESDAGNRLGFLSGDEEVWRTTILNGILKDTSLFKKLDEKSGIDYTTLIFLSSQALCPFFEKYAEKLREYMDSSTWLKGYCPVCGGEPLMARLEEESGKKYLQCYLCRTNWEFVRLQCHVCNNTNQETLRYFYDENDRQHRVEVCDECKTYLKVIDTRNFAESLSIVVENLATLHLDIAAKREGFIRDTNKLFGM